MGNSSSQAERTTTEETDSMETGTATSQSTVPRVQLLMLSKQEIEKITSPHIPEQAVQNDKPGMPSLLQRFCVLHRQ